MSWKKFLMGEKMPDREDPKYAGRYEREVAWGRRFAEKMHIAAPFRGAQACADLHPRMFLSMVAAGIFLTACLNIVRLTEAFSVHRSGRPTATELQEKRLQGIKDSKTTNDHADIPGHD